MLVSRAVVMSSQSFLSVPDRKQKKNPAWLKKQHKKISHPRRLICKRRKILLSYAVPLLFMNNAIHSRDTEWTVILISSPYNGGHRLHLLLKISGSCSKASSTISIRCFSPASSSLGSGYCVLFLIYAFRLFLLSNTLTSKRVFVKTSSWICQNFAQIKKSTCNLFVLLLQ